MKAYTLINEYLQKQNVETVFTLMSEGSMNLVAEMREGDEYHIVNVRHEQGAVAMADGYSRGSDEIGVCIVGRGPAVAQTGTALVTARKRNTDLLVLVPDGSSAFSSVYPAKRFERYDTKGFEQEAFLKSTIGNVISINSHDAIIPNLKEGFRQIRTGGGPVAVNIPMDVLNSELDSSYEITEKDVVSPDSYGVANSVVRPDDDSIAKAVDLYLDSDATKAPIILAGQGALRGSAPGVIEELAERMNAMLATTLQARGAFDEHPFSVGVVGDLGSHVANEYFNESDFILAVGCSLNHRTTDSGRLIDDDTKLVHVDTDAAAIEKFTPVDVGIRGDAGVALRAVNEELDRLDIDRTEEFWTDKVRDRLEKASKLDERDFPDHPDAIDPRELVRNLNEILPEDRVIVPDGGHLKAWVVDAVDTEHPGDLIWTMDFSSIGLALPMGIGAALGSEEKTAVSFTGDAGMMMAIQELETAARHDVPLVVIVMNDGALAAEYHSLAKSGGYAESALMAAPEFAEVATSLGAEGHEVRSISNLGDIHATLSRKPDGPVVVDCKINRELRHHSMG